VVFSRQLRVSTLPALGKRIIFFEDSVKVQLQDLEPENRLIVPSNQLKELTQQQLDEEKTIALDAANPNLPENLVLYNCNKGVYLEDEREVSQLLSHFTMESMFEYEAEQNEPEQNEEEEEKEEPEKEEKQTKVSTDEKETAQQKPKLRNQFKFSERACQTFNQPTRDQAVATVPPSVQNYKGQVSRWLIYDAYLNDVLVKFEANETIESSQKKQTPENKSTLKLLYSDKLKSTTKQMEYVVYHNSEPELYHELKFWKGEEKKPELNHLWRVKSLERRCVTSIIFNKKYTKLFAVGMGSYEFNRPKTGIVSIYTLKTPTHPEFRFETKSGVMSMDFSADHPALLCVGFYNGAVGVYDIRKPVSPMLYEVKNPEDQHGDPVWEIRWLENTTHPSFLSISSDGTIVKWEMQKNELCRTVVLEMKRSDHSDDHEGLLRTVQACTFDLNPVYPSECLVGTEFGEVYCYYLDQNKQSPKVYEGHKMQVYAVRWSPFNSETFLTASEDWTVKLWNSKHKTPIMEYDLVAPVGDISWSQFCSTSFAAVTLDNKIHCFDLSVNRNGPCVNYNNSLKKHSQTRIAFSPDTPMIIAGTKTGICDILLVPEHISKSSPEKEEEKRKLENVLQITGTNVLDLKEIDLPSYSLD